LNSGRDGLQQMADEASKLGLILTTESGVAAEKFNDSLTRLAKVQTGFTNNLTQALLPALEFVANDLNNAALRTNGFKDATVDLVQFLSKLTFPLEAVAVLALNFGYILKQTGNEIGGIAAQLAALARLDFKGFRAIGDMMKEDADAARREIDKLSVDILNWSKRLNQSVTAPQASYSNEGRNYQRLGERISAPLISAANTAAAAGAKIKGAISGIDPQGVLQSVGSSAPSDRQFLTLVNDIADGMQRMLTLDDADFVRRFGNIQDMIARTPTAQLERARQDMLELADAYQQGLFGIVGSTEAVDRYAETVRTRLGIDVPKVVQESFEEISEFAKQAERNIQDALGDTLKKTLSGDFKSIGQLWKNLLINMAAEAIAADIGRKLFPKGIGSGSFFSSILSFLGFAKGGAFSGGQVMPFASGGVISSPTMFPMRGGMGLMGEAGPEAIMPLRRGPDGRLGVEGGGSTTNVTYNVAAGVSRNEMITALQVMQQSIESRMIGIMRRQGVA